MNVRSGNGDGTRRSTRARRRSASSDASAVVQRGRGRQNTGEAVELDGRVAKRGRGRPLTDDKRRIILDAALGTFAARGYHGTSVPEVAEAAGVGVGTLYRYFADKNALVNEVYRDAKQTLKSALL